MYQHDLYDYKGHAASQDVEFQAGPISVKLIKGPIAKSKVRLIFLILIIATTKYYIKYYQEVSLLIPILIIS